jgi:hypothetical protein
VSVAAQRLPDPVSRAPTLNEFEKTAGRHWASRKSSKSREAADDERRRDQKRRDGAVEQQEPRLAREC